MQLYRYLEKRYVDEFFDTGRLMLSSFIRCRNIEGARRDDREGKANFAIAGMNNGVYGVFNVGLNTHFLCTSRIASDQLMKKFGVDDYFIVKRPLHFAYEIAKCMTDVVGIDVSDCTYCDNGYETSSNGIFIDSPPDVSEEKALEWLARQQARLDDMLRSRLGNRGLFTKRLAYQDEAEYRFAWTLARQANDQQLVECKDAVRYCARRRS